MLGMDEPKKRGCPESVSTVKETEQFKDDSVDIIKMKQKNNKKENIIELMLVSLQIMGENTTNICRMVNTTNGNQVRQSVQSYHDLQITPKASLGIEELGHKNVLTEEGNT